MQEGILNKKKSLKIGMLAMKFGLQVKTFKSGY
jgi:hypothetical protein